MNWFWDNILLKKEERVGMLVFVSILFCLILVKWYLVVIYTPEPTHYNVDLFANVEYTRIEPELQENQTSEKSSTFNITKRHKTKQSKKKLPIEQKQKKGKHMPSEAPLFEFDPNNTSMDSLLLLGLGKYASNNITKYRAKGGKFNKPNDLQKIYGMDSTLFNKILPFIKIKKQNYIEQTKNIVAKKKVFSKPPLALKSIDINLADTTEFKKLKGIGKVYANRIVKFRNSLGGYFSIDQISKVWGISDSLFTTIQPYLTIDTSLVKKKNINLMDKEALVKHPYIDWKKAKVIASYKRMHGDYQSMEDFDKMHGISDAFVDTLKQYFVAE